VKTEARFGAPHRAHTHRPQYKRQINKELLAVTPSTSDFRAIQHTRYRQTVWYPTDERTVSGSNWLWFQFHLICLPDLENSEVKFETK
jgi:hypothetical protein